MKDLISVVIPAYNAGAYIERCVNSILCQTYQNLEIIAVDDGSTDDTAALLDAFAEKDDRVKPLHQENSGAAAARKAGCELAKGNYITFVDSDDYIDSRMLEYLMTLMHSGEYQIACCDLKTVSRNQPDEAADLSYEVKEYGFDGIMKHLYDKKFWSLCGKLFRRELFDDGIITENLKVSEDLLMAYSLYRHCRLLTAGTSQLYYYYRHSGSVMAEGLNETQIHDSMRAYRLIAQDMDAASEAYEYHIQNLLSNDFGFLNSIILRHTCRNCYAEIRKEILQYRKYAFKHKDSSALNNRHRLGVILLQFCPPLFDLMIKIKG